MDTQLLDADVLYVFLPPEPLLKPEVALLREHLPEVGDKHLILDLSRVTIITSPSIGSLLLLQKQLAQQGRRLVLCGAHLATRCIFHVAGLDAHLEFVENKDEALTAIRGPAVESR